MNNVFRSSKTSAEKEQASSADTAKTTASDFLFSQEEEEDFCSLTFTASQFITERSKEERFQDHYTLGELMGSGGFGEVFRCTHKATGHERAAKIVQKTDKKKDRAVQKEFELLAQLDHPNLIKAYEMFEDDQAFYILTDLYQGQDLFDLLIKEGPLQEKQVAVILHCLLCCVNYCHQHNIVHRDLKLENVLLHGSDFHNLRLIDFGLAKQQSPDRPFDQLVGTPSYLSPQMIEGEYHHACDVWALGVVAYVLLCGEFPFGEFSDPNIVQNITSGRVPFTQPVFACISPECIDFIGLLLSKEEFDRPTAQQALKHPWLQRHAKEEIPALEKGIKGALKAVRRFEYKNTKLKLAAGALIASQFMCLTHRDEMDAVFRALDQGCHGSLSVEDLHLAFAEYLEIEGTEEQLEELLMPIITHNLNDGPPVVKYSEFAAIVALEGRNTGQAKELVRAAYNYLDRDGKGHITTQDLHTQLALHEMVPTPESSSRIIMAEVTNKRILSQAAFERAILGKKRASNNPTSMTKSMGKFAKSLMGK